MLREERDWLADVRYDPNRQAYFERLLVKLDQREIAAAADPSTAVDQYAELFFRHMEGFPQEVPRLGAQWNWDENVALFRSEWQSGGFCEPVIRNGVFTILLATQLFTDPSLKYFISRAFWRKDLGLSEVYASGQVYKPQIARGIFEGQDKSALFINFLADTSDEMLTKRVIDNVMSRLTHGLLGWPKLSNNMRNRFFESAQGREIRQFGTIDWWCGDSEYAPKSDYVRSQGYLGIMHDAFEVERNLPQYKTYVADPMMYIKSALDLHFHEPE